MVSLPTERCVSRLKNEGSQTSVRAPCLACLALNSASRSRSSWGV